MNKWLVNITQFIKDLPILKQILDWSKKYSLPGLEGVPVYNVISFIIDELKEDDITTRANSVAYSFFLSLFPLILFLLPVISLTPLAESYIVLFRESMQGVLPEDAERYIFGIIDGIQLKGGYGWLSLGFFLAVFFASSGMLTLMRGFDKSYDTTFKPRGFVESRVVAILLTILLSFIMIMSVVVIVMSRFVINYVVDQLDLSYSTIALVILKWLVVILLFYTVITIIYRYGPAMYHRVKFFNAGATLATFFSLLSSVAFSYFVNNFSRYNEIYGSIAGLIIILIWLQLNAFIILAGFELNASIAINRDRMMAVED